MNNPFSQKGRIVTGEAFIGRQQAIREVSSNVTDQPLPNNLAIIGYPRIGKSSLAKQAIMENKAKLVEQQKIPVFIDFSKFSEHEAFFRYLVRYANDELKKLKVEDEDLTYALEETFSAEDWDDLTYYVEKFFEASISLGYYFIFIIDEFDEARNLFQNRIEAFKTLRGIAYDSSKYGVAIVTTSRRSIKDIEIRSSCESSTFNLIFSKTYLRDYNEKELEEYFGLYEKLGIELTVEQKERIQYYCGSQPYLLAVLGFEIVDAHKRDGFDGDIDNTFAIVRLSFLEYYDQLSSLLREDETYDKMLQLLFGPMMTVTNDDILELRDTYGLVKDKIQDGENILVAYSPHFQEYLEQVGKNIDFWPLWTELEQAIRALITKIFQDKYQENWEQELIKIHPDLFNGFEKDGRFILGAIQKREYAKEDMKSDNLLDYVDAQPLFEFMMRCWNDFKPVFGAEKTAKRTLQEKVSAIVKVRNPYAHSRFNSITPLTVQKAELYCKEILEKIRV